MKERRVIAYYPDFCDLFDGCVSCAVFLSQLVYWHGEGKDGKPRYNIRDHEDNFWLAKSFKDWHEETRITRHKFERVLTTLRNRGIITTRIMRYMGSPTLHVRFLALDGRRETITAEQIIKEHMQLSDSHLLIPVNANAETCNFTTETTTETTTESDEPAGKPATPATADSTTLNPPGVDQPQEQPPQATSGDPVKTKKNSGLSKLVIAWKDLMAQKYGYTPNLTRVQHGKLKNIYDKLGADTGAVVQWAIQNWVKVVAAVNEQAGGASSGPSKPDPGYLLVHADIARLRWKTYMELPPQKPMPVFAPIDKSSLKDQTVKATKEEVEAIFKEFGWKP